MNKLESKLKDLNKMLIEDGYNGSNIVIQTLEEIREEAFLYKRRCTELRDEYLQPELDKYKNIKVERTKGKSDSEQLHTEVFKLANKLAINGYGNEAVKMHGICNGM